MRLPEAKIKEAILHPERMVREEALQYFSECYSRDLEVMTSVIKAIETYGRGHAFLRVGKLAQLAQTEATVDWAIRELGADVEAAHHQSYSSALSMLLYSADPRLLIARADEIVSAPGFPKELVVTFRERLDMAAWDGERCWHELERISGEDAGKPYSSDVDFDRARGVVQALAPYGEKYVDRILELLSRKVTDFETDPMGWMEIFVVMLAGEMRLERAIPLLVQKLHDDGDILSEECVEALAKIGTDSAAEAVAEDWLAFEWEYRLFAGSALEKIHSDTAVRKCLALLPQEKDLALKTQLAFALLGQFADEGIEPVREVVRKRAYDPATGDLMAGLIAVSTILGASFPEYATWKRQAERRLVRQEEQLRETERFFERPPTTSLSEEQAEIGEPKPAPIVKFEKQVGRNDPCPCGSGKKFKKCCMNKQRRP